MADKGQKMAIEDHSEQGITNTMVTALEEEQFSVCFQPKYDLRSGCMIGAEALVRWNHPEWGCVAPEEFIPLFEKNECIFQMDQYVWEQTCVQLREWKEKGYQLLPVSVNVSRVDLFRENLVDTLLGFTQKHGIDPSYLHLEITESAYIENPLQIAGTVEELRKRGFLIEMDDFGSGYSSLSMFSQMKMDILKLDMKFVQNETAKPVNQSILSDIINMAHRMCLKVVAEGVEQKDQVERLRAIGCDFVQGYFYASPMSATEFEPLLKKQNVHFPSSQNSLHEFGMKTLLIADEDAGYREKVRGIFEGEYQVLAASDAESVFEQIKTCGEEGISALILSTTLPKNGASFVLKTMRQNPELCNVPILSTISTPGEDGIEQRSIILKTDDFLCKCHPMFDLRRRVEHLIEIAELQERENRLLYEVSRDPLTGLKNRRGLQASMDSLRNSDLPMAVCMFDLDNLKSINDNFGHSVGDQMIRAFSDLICRGTRSDDVLCRYGGDEFVLILMNIEDREVVKKRVTDICREFLDRFADEPFCASCSVGVALCGAEEKLSDRFIERADQALYRAKRENKGGCCLWEGILV